MDFSKLTKQMLEFSKENPYVKSFWIRGSQAIGRATKNSDIDFVLLISSKSKLESIKKELQKFLVKTNMPAYLGDGEWEEWQFPNGQDIGIRFYTYKELENIVNNFYKDEYFFLENMDLIQNVLVESNILYDENSKIKSLKLRIEKKPEKFLLNVAEKLIKRLENKLIQWDGDRGVAKGVFQHISDMWHITREIVFSHYLLNYEFSMNAMKRYYTGDLERFKPNILKEIKIITNIDYDLSNSKEKIRALKNIVKKFRNQLNKKRAE